MEFLLILYKKVKLFFFLRKLACYKIPARNMNDLKTLIKGHTRVADLDPNPTQNRYRAHSDWKQPDPDIKWLKLF